MTLIVGLGNPGQQYLHNRHNIGFLTVDALIDRFKASRVTKTSFLGDAYKSKDTVFLKPTTYMNLSGKSVTAVANFFKPQKIIVIHDDLDLNFGALKVKIGGGNGGHNGLKSIDESIGKEYIRVRMGIGKPEHKSQVSSYVLSDFNADEQPHLQRWIDYACNCVEMLLQNDIGEVVARFNTKSIENVI
jgi:PTH1 family peptidyl-tRNA hydrolase